MIEKFAMNGYGPYVWSSFVLVLGALLVLYFLARRRLKKALNSAQKHALMKESHSVVSKDDA